MYEKLFKIIKDAVDEWGYEDSESFVSWLDGVLSTWQLLNPIEHTPPVSRLQKATTTPFSNINDLKVGDRVEFVANGKLMQGNVVIVDRNGIFGDNSQPYCDVRLDNGDWYKHLKGKDIKLISRDSLDTYKEAEDTDPSWFWDSMTKMP